MNLPLGAAFFFIRNGMNVKQDKCGAGLPITRIETISESTVDPSRVGYAGLTEADAKTWLLEPGDILFSHINSVQHIGKCAVYRGEPEKLVHGMNLLCFRSDRAKLEPEFAKYLLRSSVFRARLANCIKPAVNQASVSIGDLQKIAVSLPPLPEQRRIAEILDKADALRVKRRAAIAQLDTLTQSIFLEMFGDPITNPKGWPAESLSDVCHCYSGGTPSKAISRNWDGALPWFSPKDMKAEDLYDSSDHINESIPNTSNLKLLPPSTVAIVVRGMILAHTFPVAVLRVPCTINQDLKALLPKKEIRSQFLASCLRAQRSYVLALVSESAHGTKKIDNDTLAKIKILLPSTRLQNEFENRVLSVQRLKANYEIALATTDSLFESAQANAFHCRA